MARLLRQATQVCNGGAIVNAKTQHTPGPWEVWHRRPRHEFSGGLPEITGKGGTPVIADIRWNIVNERDGEANAALIAAAPELLEALTGLLDACPASCEDSRLITAQRQAEATIAKAEGKV